MKLPTVFVGGYIIGILLNPYPIPISSAISHACKISGLTADTSNLTFVRGSED